MTSMVASADTLTLHRYQCSNDSYTLDLGDGVELTLMLVPAGEFIMGAGEHGSNDPAQYLVKLSSYLMGATPITQSQWRVVAGYETVDVELNLEPSEFKGDDLPVERIDWYEATEFCRRLSQKTGKNFHLPSESQWEYACRAETVTDYHFGPKITPELANYGNEVGGTTVVKSYPPNRYGLYDMHGNVWEWCQDHFRESSQGFLSDGSP